MGKRYEITGRTATMFTQYPVGEIVELDLDDETETLLRDAGAIRELSKQEAKEAKAEAEDEAPAKKPAARSTRAK